MNNESENREQRHRKSQGWKFTFLGGTAIKRGDNKSQAKSILKSTQNELKTKQVFPLSITKVGDHIVIHHIQTDNDILSDLVQMGLTLDSEVQVTSKTKSGSIIIQMQDRQIGLGAEMAQQVMVTSKDFP